MTDLRNMKVDELKDIAREYSIVGAWKMTKERLIEAILEAARLNGDNDKYFDTAASEEPEATQEEPETQDDEVIEEESQEEPEEETNDEVIVEEDEAVQDAKKNGWEEIATKNITNAYNWIVGENENTLQDCEEDSDEYKDSYNYLRSGNEIMDDIYHEAITTEYGEGYCGGKAPSEMRFAGKKFCMNLIRDLLKKDGYLTDEDATEKKPRGKLIEYKGKSQTLGKWAEELGFTPQTLFARLYISNWPVEKAFETPSRRKKTEEEA